MRAIPTLKISISGVRGVVGDSLTPALLTRFAQAFGTYAGSGTIIVGRDTRTSGEMVRQAVFAGLLSSGCRPIDLDVCPVPTVQLAVRERRAQGGIAITASHNPAEWNALKFIGDDGLFLGSGPARELLDIYHQGEYLKVPGPAMRSVERMDGALDLHIRAILDAVGPLPRSTSRLRVGLDACNGAGSLVSPRLLEALGADVVSINTTPDGLFPRPAEPLPENLTALCDLVRAERCDLGFAQDMDADRLAVVDRTGRPIGEDYTLVLSAWYVLRATPGVVVANLSTSAALDDVAARFGSRVLRTKIGEANVTERMRAEKAVIGGEGNGGVIYPRINFGRDSLVGMALILHLLSASGRTLIDLLSELPSYRLIKTKLECPSSSIPGVLRMLKREYRSFPLDSRDGVKVTLPSGWFLVRGSNTEPIVRIVAEAGSDEDAQRIVDEVFARVKSTVDSR
ncbi:MAG: phosphoglucosamine mutase [Acidobacteriota bacterium]